MLSKTYIPKVQDLEKKWYILDAKDQVLGRLATRISRLLTGKGKTIYTPHMDCGDHVIVLNCTKVRVTGNKAKDKIYTHYTGYAGGLREYNYETLFAKKPTEVISRAVERMLPKNRMAAKMMKRLHIYTGDTHTQQAQKPTPLS